MDKPQMTDQVQDAITIAVLQATLSELRQLKIGSDDAMVARLGTMNADIGRLTERVRQLEAENAELKGRAKPKVVA